MLPLESVFFFIFRLTFEGSGIVRHSTGKSELSFVAKLK